MADSILPRDDLRALEGYHSAAGRRPRPAQHQREPVPAARRVPRPAGPTRCAPSTTTAIPIAPRARCATRLGAFLGQPSGRVFCANGSNEVLQTLLLTYGGPGRSAAMFEPTYALHAHIARLTGTAVVTGDRADDFSIDVDAAEALIASERPSVVFVCSPNNPTGTVEDRDVGRTTGDGRGRRRRAARRRRGLRRVRAVGARSSSSTRRGRSSSCARTRRCGRSPRSGSGSRSARSG